jgi:hypothetical protein
MRDKERHKAKAHNLQILRATMHGPVNGSSVQQSAANATFSGC